MRTRTLIGLASTLFAAGVAIAGAGLHPSINSPAISRLGLILILASVLAWLLGEIRNHGQLTEDEKQAYRNEGYQLGARHAALGLFDPPPAAQATPRPISLRRTRTIHSVNGTMYLPPEKEAQ